MATMHWRRADSATEARSLATGRRKATFAGAGPQPSMFPWFQRSTHIRRTWAEAVRCPHADASGSARRRQTHVHRAPVRRETAVERSPRSRLRGLSSGENADGVASRARQRLDRHPVAREPERDLVPADAPALARVDG